MNDKLSMEVINMKNIKSIIMILAVILISLSPVYAHKMTIEPVEDGIIEVLYDDGSFSSRTEVTVYDSKGEIIDSGKLDEEGKFAYDTSGDAAYLEASDGLGHKDEWKVGEAVAGSSGGSKALKIGAVVLILAGVAGFSYKKKGKSA